MENNKAFFSEKKNEPIQIELTGRDGFFGILFLILSVLSVDFGLFGGFCLGFSVAVIAMGICLICFFAKNGGIGAYGLFCNVSAMLIAASYGVFESGLTKFIGFFAVCLLFSLAVLSYGQVEDVRDWRKIADVISALIITPLSRSGEMMRAIFQKLTKGDDKGKKNVALLVGILASIPAVCIVVPLLMSSDAAFEALMSLTVFSDIPRVIGSVFLGAALFFYVFSGVLAYAKKRSVRTVPSSAYPEKGGINHYGLGAFLGVICAVYCVYLLSQTGYFFGAFSALLPKDFSVAEYARRGFFEMVVICMLNLILISVSVFGARRDGKRIYGMIRIPCIFLCGFSVALCATVCAKLALYMKRFGLTELRLYTTAFSVLIAVMFVLLTVYLFKENFPYFKVLTVCAALLMVILAWVDVDTFIARYNVYAYENGLTVQIDLYTLYECGDPGTDALIRLLDCKDGTVARDAAEYLLDDCYRFGQSDSADQWWDTSEMEYEKENAPLPLKNDLVMNENKDFRSYTYTESCTLKKYRDAWPKICSLLNK